MIWRADLHGHGNRGNIAAGFYLSIISGMYMFNARVFVGAAFAALFVIFAHATEPTATDMPVASPVAPAASAVSDAEKKCRPSYPIASLLNNEQGTVRLQFTVGVDGLPVSIKVLRSSGYSKLDYATMDALNRCRFKPAIKDGKPVQAKVAVDYTWALDPAYPRSTVQLGGLPLNKTYDELSDADQVKLRSMFDKLPDGDEPPYPANGLQEIVELIHDFENNTMVTGKLSMDVEIGADGTPRSVTVRNSPDKALTKYATGVLTRSSFKPGKCGGTPCKMSFPFDLEFAVEHGSAE